jgi:NTP pyrophosphatase (non-canonical NTP hydrolase)
MGYMKELEERVWANKVARGFNTTNIEREFNYTYAELAEAYEAHRKAKPDVGEELADVMLFVVSLARMLDVDLEQEVAAKLEKNEKRQYVEHNGHHVRVYDEKSKE